MLLSAPDSLVVSITKNHVDSDEEASTAGVVLSTPPQSHVNSFGINGLDMLKFTYKVILQLIYCAFLTEFLFKNMSFVTKNYKWVYRKFGIGRFLGLLNSLQILRQLRSTTRCLACFWDFFTFCLGLLIFFIIQIMMFVPAIWLVLFTSSIVLLV